MSRETQITIAGQRELDQEILYFVRGMQQTAPITEESIAGYLVNHARRRVTVARVRDRVMYLVSAGLLARKVEWDGGEVTRYEIAAKGMNVLDGVEPWPGWKPATEG
jgi:hypothetical protein